MKRYEVIESRVYQHKTSGRTASIYGACPWGSPTEAKEWDTASKGWTIRDNKRGTVGIGRAPFKTQGEAQAHMDAHAAVFKQEEL